MPTNSAPLAPQPARFRELYTPKLVTVLREGYGTRALRADAVAGLTVAIVALPLSMAIAIASGAKPEQGLYTAIIGGFLVSALGGSRFQIGGPAGAFIVLVAATVAQHGMAGLILATALSGVMMVGIGLARAGTTIKFIPLPVTVGFTAGIAAIIAASQLHPFLGLVLEGPEPGPLAEKLPVLAGALGTVNATALMLGAGTMAVIVILRKLAPAAPGMLIGVVIASALTGGAGLDVATIGSQFGGIPQSLPLPHLPAFNSGLVLAVLPNAFAFALLGSIESLLSAVVADGMTGRRHRSNCELVAQGIANMGSALFGGICVTGTIARTATNVRAGAHGPVAGMMHSLFLLVFVLLLAPLARFIPLASLAGVLLVVAWNMIEKDAIRALVRASWGDALVLLVTVALTLFRDLTEAIIAGVALGALLVLQRMARATAIRSETPYLLDDVADRAHSTALEDQDPDIVIYRISGPLFFGAAASLIALLDRIADTRRVLIVDLKAVPFLDSTAAHLIHSLAQAAHRRGIKLILSGTDHDMRVALFAQGVGRGLASYKPDIDTALTKARRMLTSASER